MKSSVNSTFGKGMIMKRVMKDGGYHDFEAERGVLKVDFVVILVEIVEGNELYKGRNINKKKRNKQEIKKKRRLVITFADTFLLDVLWEGLFKDLIKRLLIWGSSHIVK